MEVLLDLEIQICVDGLLTETEKHKNVKSQLCKGGHGAEKGGWVHIFSNQIND